MCKQCKLERETLRDIFDESLDPVESMYATERVLTLIYGEEVHNDRTAEGTVRKSA